jgi:two-component system nitrogen regulation sensor histidine kinase GlnL
MSNDKGWPAWRAVENLNTAVLLFDAGLHLSYLNPAAESLLAESARQAVGRSPEELMPACGRVAAALRRAAERNRPFMEREMRLRFMDGRQIIVCCMVTPVIEAGERTGLLVEMIPQDRHLRIIREGLLTAQNNATRALVRGLAHEIKNPLGGLRGAAQLLEQELGDEDLKEYTRIIIGEADRLQNLVDRMLGPRTLPHRGPVNIHEVLERVRTLVVAEVPPEVILRRDYDPSLPQVQADADQLIQALLNLVRNAAQAVGSAGTVILRSRSVRQFTIAGRRHKLVARIDVVDDGPGIPEDMLQNIFFPLVTTRPEGVGLGLPIAQSLIHKNGGIIECTSQPGETAFTIYLPLDEGQDVRNDEAALAG